MIGGDDEEIRMVVTAIKRITNTVRMVHDDIDKSKVARRTLAVSKVKGELGSIIDGIEKTIAETLEAINSGHTQVALTLLKNLQRYIGAYRMNTMTTFNLFKGEWGRDDKHVDMLGNCVIALDGVQNTVEGGNAFVATNDDIDAVVERVMEDVQDMVFDLQDNMLEKMLAKGVITTGEREKMGGIMSEETITNKIRNMDEENEEKILGLINEKIQNEERKSVLKTLLKEQIIGLKLSRGYYGEKTLREAISGKLPDGDRKNKMLGILGGKGRNYEEKRDEILQMLTGAEKKEKEKEEAKKEAEETGEPETGMEEGNNDEEETEGDETERLDETPENTKKGGENGQESEENE